MPSNEQNDTINPLVCCYCNKTYASTSSLNYHKKTSKACLKLQKEYKDNEIKCQYCNKIFSKQSNLIYHQKTTKSCLLIQEVQDNSLVCIGCNKKFTTNANFDRHTSICIELKNKEKEELIEKLLQEKKILQDEKKILQDEIKEQANLIFSYKVNASVSTSKLEMFEKLCHEQKEKLDILHERLVIQASKTTNINNNNNIDLKFFLVKEDVDREINEKFTYKHIMKGISGVAGFLKDNIVTKNNTLMYKCIDPSRQIFKYTDNDGNEIKDIKASKLIELSRPGLIEKTYKLQSKSYNEYIYLTERYNGEDEIADQDTKKRIDIQKLQADAAQDMILNKFSDDKFSDKISKELVKILTC
jgi:hypothetical protein